MSTAAPGTRPAGAGPATHRWCNWVGLVARLLLGAVVLYAGLTKVTDLVGSVQSVVAYQLFPYAAAEFIGTVLPVLEIALGLLLLVGLLTRPVALITGILMLGFVAGIASAWARGLAIDCGCFGTGGPVAPEDTEYLQDILRDVGLLALAAWLALRPHTPFSVDSILTKGR